MVNRSDKEGLFRKVDCIRIPVSNLTDGLKFYRDKLGHKLIWRKESSIGLEIPESEAELVIHTEQDEPETDIKVKSVELAAKRFIEAGGTIVKEPFDIPIGKCAILMDPWGNKFVLLDTSKGIFKTDSNGNVIGLE
ncbi:MAG: VOC family protein [Candidatus Hermodarchaeota archaeon]